MVNPSKARNRGGKSVVKNAKTEISVDEYRA